jgi:hypothetical protein
MNGKHLLPDVVVSEELLTRDIVTILGVAPTEALEKALRPSNGTFRFTQRSIGRHWMDSRPVGWT